MFDLGLKREEALWEAKRLYSHKYYSLFRNTLANANTINKSVKLPNSTLGNNLLKDYKSVNFSLRSHPMALLRDVLNTKY